MSDGCLFEALAQCTHALWSVQEAVHKLRWVDSRGRILGTHSVFAPSVAFFLLNELSDTDQDGVPTAGHMPSLFVWNMVQ